MKTQADGFKRIFEVLDLLEIPYQVVGSLASSLHGIPRATMNFDFVADLHADQIEEFVAKLKADFYADAEMTKEALARGRSFNLIHLASSFKFDIFPPPKRRVQPNSVRTPPVRRDNVAGRSDRMRRCHG
jgi:hypothetical protein